MTTRKRLTQRSEFGGRQKKADPYTMHQDRINPPVEKYMNGDPSAWAEDLHDIPPAGTPRNPIGLPDMLDNTWDHKDADVWGDNSAYDNADTFSASDDQGRRLAASRHNRRIAALQVKADHCIRMAEYIFPSSSDRTIEAQALDFMSLPERAIRATLARLAEECGEDEKEASEEEDEKEASVRNAGRRRSAEDDEDEKESKKSKKSKKSEDEDEDEDEEVESKKSRKSKKSEDEDEDEEVESKKSRKSKKADDDEDEDDVEASEDDEDEKESKKSKKSKKADEDEDEEVESKKSRKSKKAEEDEDEEVESKKSRKSKKAAKARSLIAALHALIAEDGDDEDGEVEAMLSEMGFGVAAESEDEDEVESDMDMMEEESSMEDLDAEMGMILNDDLDYADPNLDGMDLDLDGMELDDLMLTPEVDPFPNMMGDDDLVLAQLQGRTATRKATKSAPQKQAPKKEGVRSLGRVTTASALRSKENADLESLWKTDPDVSKVFNR